MKETLLLATALFATNVHAAPENGWWWNPAEPGTGYNIETQNNTLFVATFVYNDDGNPVWYSGSGQLNRNDMVTIDLLRSEGGQCLGCEFTDSMPSDSGFRITLDFESNSNGTVILDGESTSIERFNFNYGNGLQKMLGTWTFAVLNDGLFSLGSSDFIEFDTIRNDTVIGSRIMNESHFSGVGVTDDGVYVGLTALRSGTEAFYRFTFNGLNCGDYQSQNKKGLSRSTLRPSKI